MKKIVMIAVYLLMLKTGLQSQPNFTLQAAIDTALAKNIEVMKSGLQSEQAQVLMRQSRTNMLPDLGANFNHGINQGRSIDPFTNQFVNQTVNFAGYGLSSNVVLFNGMRLQNTARQFSSAYEASQLELQQAKDNLILNVMLAYLQVLNIEDLLVAAIRQKEVSVEQLNRLQVLDSKGAISPSQVTDVKGQLMNDELNILNLRNTLETAKLSLSQLMNIPYQKTMTLERMNTEEFLSVYGASSNDVYQNALKQFSLVRAVELRRKSAQYAWRASKGNLFPVLSIGGNMQTNYSSVAANSSGKIPYKDQLSNNIFYTVNLGLSVPLFNNLRFRNNVKLAEIEFRNSKLDEENTKLRLRQQIEQAHLNMTNAYDRYLALAEQVNAYTTSFKAAEARLTAGVGTTVDYIIAKTNLDRANISLISSRYDFVLRKKILDFYQNAVALK